MILNGIEDFIVRDDLADRAIPIVLPEIPEDERRDEKRLWLAFEEARPRIVGALLDAVATALANLPNVELVQMPRMADFARWVVAAEPALPWEPGTFMAAYAQNRDEAALIVLEDSVLAPALLAFMEDRAEPWEGTASALLELLNKARSEGEKAPDGWPKKPNSLSGMLRRLVPNLRAAGVEVSFEREGHRRKRTIYLEQTGE
jgi:hypothetical protein